MNQIALRDTIPEIVARRNKALELYEIAFHKIAEAGEAVKAARLMANSAHPGIDFSHHREAEEVKEFLNAVRVPDCARYLRTARRTLDLMVWRWVIERSDLRRLMDVDAKAALEQQMAYVPERVDYDSKQLINADEIARGLPEATVENIVATIDKFAGEADMIFRRGIANAFSRLDRRFRSHDGFKIGSRLILTYFFNDYGSINYGRTRDTLIDIERVFSVLDGKPQNSFTSALDAVDMGRRGHYGRRQSEVETEYFKIRGFMNGNAHLWFQRDDLVVKVNKILAEWYGEVIGDGQTQEEDPFENVKTTPAKRYGFFPTPEPAQDEVIKAARIHPPLITDPQLRILEPSAGTGNLARRCMTTPEAFTSGWARADEEAARYRAERRFDNLVDCVEIQGHLADSLKQEGIYNRVFNQDFLKLDPATTGLYDRIVMNPPFDLSRDIDHVVHALKFLKPDGILVSIMSAGTEFRETKKSIAFRDLVKQRGGYFEDLPERSFAEVGTNVNTIICVIGRRSRW